MNYFIYLILLCLFMFGFNNKKWGNIITLKKFQKKNKKDPQINYVDKAQKFAKKVEALTMRKLLQDIHLYLVLFTFLIYFYFYFLFYMMSHSYRLQNIIFSETLLLMLWTLTHICTIDKILISHAKLNQ